MTTKLEGGGGIGKSLSGQANKIRFFLQLPKDTLVNSKLSEQNSALNKGKTEHEKLPPPL